MPFKRSRYATVNPNISHGHKTSVQLKFDEKCCSISEFRSRIFKVFQLTNGVQFNQWEGPLVPKGIQIELALLQLFLKLLH